MPRGAPRSPSRGGRCRRGDLRRHAGRPDAAGHHRGALGSVDSRPRGRGLARPGSWPAVRGRAGSVRDGHGPARRDPLGPVLLDDHLPARRGVARPGLAGSRRHGPGPAGCVLVRSAHPLARSADHSSAPAIRFAHRGELPLFAPPEVSGVHVRGAGRRSPRYAGTLCSARAPSGQPSPCRRMSLCGEPLSYRRFANRPPPTRRCRVSLAHRLGRPILPSALRVARVARAGCLVAELAAGAANQRAYREP